MKKIIKVGVIGAVKRGSSFKFAIDIVNKMKVQAVCDIDEERLEEKRLYFKAAEKYTDYREMIEKADINAVIVATPMPFHVPQSIAALEKNLHVLSEVPAGVSIKECRKLVKAANKSRGIYMMAENFTYMKPNAIVKEIARKGLFGELYYAEGEYIHELKGL
ncbi:MAG TPA: Gfo/Idh/MocA family oxidoreductase, partial [bacterium]|nr:Gfo/Idh/MocA family oxidoreductase [bacterium]